MKQTKSGILTSLVMAASLALGGSGCATLNNNHAGNSSYNLAKDDFKKPQDSENPNALIVYPGSDYNGVFSGSRFSEMTNVIKASYDTRIVIANSEDELYKALDNTKNIDLLVINGHGSKQELTLGQSSKPQELNFLDTSDYEIKEHLRSLNNNAVIFLNSCSTGKGGKKAENLANLLANNSPEGVKVYAPKGKPTGLCYSITSVYPFAVEIRSYNIAKQEKLVNIRTPLDKKIGKYVRAIFLPAFLPFIALEEIFGINPGGTYVATAEQTPTKPL